MGGGIYFGVFLGGAVTVIQFVAYTGQTCGFYTRSQLLLQRQSLLHVLSRSDLWSAAQEPRIGNEVKETDTVDPNLTALSPGQGGERRRMQSDHLTEGCTHSNCNWVSERRNIVL